MYINTYYMKLCKYDIIINVFLLDLYMSYQRDAVFFMFDMLFVLLSHVGAFECLSNT